MLKNSRKTHVVDHNFETARTKTDPKKASGRQVSRLAITTQHKTMPSILNVELKPGSTLPRVSTAALFCLTSLIVGVRRGNTKKEPQWRRQRARCLEQAQGAWRSTSYRRTPPACLQPAAPLRQLRKCLGCRSFCRV